MVYVSEHLNFQDEVVEPDRSLVIGEKSGENVLHTWHAILHLVGHREKADIGCLALTLRIL